MTWHPLVLAIWFCDLVSWAIGFDAARRIVTALPHWAPHHAGSRQLKRERAMALVAYQGQAVAVLQAASVAILLLGCSNAWRAVVPGAMCGIGVMQAMGGAGAQTWFFRIVALMVYGAWWTAVRIGNRQPEGIAWPFLGRLFLLGLPFTVLGTITWVDALASVDTTAAVDCCAVVYAAAVAPSAGSDHGIHIAPFAWVTASMTGAAALMAFALSRRYWVGHIRTWLSVGVFLLTLGWIAIAIQALRYGFGPYIYQVLQHPCPWCFFLMAHGGIGYVLFGALAVAGMEQLAMAIATVMAVRYTVLADAARQRMRTSQCRILAAILVFIIAAALPVLRWRLKFGGWMF